MGRWILPPFRVSEKAWKRGFLEWCIEYSGNHRPSSDFETFIAARIAMTAFDLLSTGKVDPSTFATKVEETTSNLAGVDPSTFPESFHLSLRHGRWFLPPKEGGSFHHFSREALCPKGSRRCKAFKCCFFKEKQQQGGRGPPTPIEHVWSWQKAAAASFAFGLTVKIVTPIIQVDVNITNQASPVHDAKKRSWWPSWPRLMPTVILPPENLSEGVLRGRI
jgi:hypothetical protein